VTCSCFYHPLCGPSTDGSHRKPIEYAPIDESYNPVIHRVNQAIRQRAVHPEKPIEPPAETLLRYSKPPEALVEKAKSEIDALIQAAEVKKGIFCLVKPAILTDH
jgi:hypothetical protein